MVASDSGVTRRSSRPRRVYLVPPARWKSARSCAAIDWSTIAPAPCSWSDKPLKTGSVAGTDRHRVDWSKGWTFAISLAGRSSTATLVARRGIYRANALIIDKARSAQRSWASWDQANKRHALTALSCCASFVAIAVPLVSGVAHSQPELASHAQLSGPVTAHTLAKSISTAVAAPQLALAEKTREIESLVVLPKTVPATRSASPSSIALLSDVSTMDLMMPIAEPDLNIASHQSLWAQVGKQFGVDPLLLYSIALVESRSLHPGGDVGPTPWLFRVNDHLVVGERHHVQMEMAVASQLNATVQDVGIMQVYYPMHRSAVRDPLSLLDPKTNISVAAKILHDGMHETRDPVLGVGYYHSHTQQLARDYGTAVMTVYQRLKGVYRSEKNAQVVAR
jgi:hypothetical protein